jgi:hypothetical protein
MEIVFHIRTLPIWTKLRSYNLRYILHGPFYVNYPALLALYQNIADPLMWDLPQFPILGRQIPPYLTCLKAKKKISRLNIKILDWQTSLG